MVTRTKKTTRSRAGQVTRNQAPKPVHSDITIPKEKNKPPAKIEEYIVLLYGEKGVGKTSLAAQFKNSLVLMTEPGRRNLSIRQVPTKNEERLDWERIQAYLEAAIQDKSVDTIVIDTVDMAYELCVKKWTEPKGIKDPREAKDHGKLWKEIKDDFRDTMNNVLDSGTGLVYISHAKVRELEDRHGNDYKQVAPECMPSCWAYLKAATDVAFYMGYIKRERFIFVDGGQSIWTSNGIEGRFEGYEIIPMGNTPKEAYKNLQLAYEGKLVVEIEEEEEYVDEG